MFHYLNQSKCYELDGLDDSIEYLATRRAMDIVGISSEEQVLVSCYNIYLCLIGGILLPYKNIDNNSCRTQFFELWLQLFTWETLNLSRA